MKVPQGFESPPLRQWLASSLLVKVKGTSLYHSRKRESAATNPTQLDPVLAPYRRGWASAVALSACGVEPSGWNPKVLTPWTPEARTAG